MSKLLLTSILVLMMCMASTSAYYEDFEDAGNLDGTLYGSYDPSTADPVVSGGILNTDYVDSGFLANGDYADFSGYITFNFGGDTYEWNEAVYVIGADGSSGPPNFAGALAGVMVQYLPQKGWMYVLQEWKAGATWSTVYLEQSGMVNPAGFSASTDYELHVVDNGDGTLDAWVQEAANPANKGHVYTNIDISGATFYGDKVAATGGFAPGVGGIKDFNIGSAVGSVGNINTGGIEVRKGGTTDTYIITITEAPPTNPSFPGVRVFLDVDDLEGQIEVDPSNPGTFDPNNALDILFTSANWSAPVTVTVTAVDDTGSEILTLYHSLVYVDSGYSPDPYDPQADCWTSPYLSNSTVYVTVIDSIEVEEPKVRAVYQRNDSNIAIVPVSGTYAQSSGLDSIQARYVLESEPSVSGPWEDVNYSSGSFSDTITVPAGGWYDIEVRALSGGFQVQYGFAEKIGVGEVFITSGQSNSCSFGYPAMTPTEDRVSAWAWTGNWQHAADPQPSLGFGGTGGSPWSRLGDMLVTELDMPVAFITTGYGGSAVYEWLPSNNNHYYKLEMGIDAAGANGVRAVLWHQGESDGQPSVETPALVYADRLTTIINATRQYAGWQIPWGIAIVGWQYFVPPFDPLAVQAVNDGQRLVTDTVPAAFEGPYTDNLDLTYRHDGAHFNAAGLQIHAERWRDAIMRRINRGDFEPDGDIDFLDFASLANKWLMTECGSCDYADLNDDGDVDLLDLSKFSNIWLNKY